MFRVSGFLRSIYIYIYIYEYEHSMYVSHIRIMGMLQFFMDIFPWFTFSVSFYLRLSRLRLQNTQTASLQRGKTRRNECPGYATKQSDPYVPVMQEIREMQTPSLFVDALCTLTTQIGSTWKGPIYGLNWTKQCTYAKTESFEK